MLSSWKGRESIASIMSWCGSRCLKSVPHLSVSTACQADEGGSVDRTILDGYAEAASELVGRFEAVSPADLYSAVVHLLPQSGSTVMDIGAGTGRDAAWLAARGCSVVAVEPVARFREAGRSLHESPHIEWLDDALPSLTQVLQRGQTYEFVLLSAVWQHLDDRQRQLAMPILRSMTDPGGCLLMSLRHGPGAPTRPCFPVSAEATIELAQANDFRLTFRRSAASVQAGNRRAGVTWTWLAFSPVRSVR